MASTSSLGNDVPTFYIGHHDSKRDHPITQEVLNHAQDANYDMLTASITTNSFYARVSAILSSHLEKLRDPGPQAELLSPVLGSLSCADPANPETHLKPSPFIPQLILTSSPWIDLTSPDPLIADISRQVLSLELQYAAFCGASNVIVAGPRFDRSGQDGLSAFARALQEVLPLAPFVQVHVSFHLTTVRDDHGSIFNLATHAREIYAHKDARGEVGGSDAFSAWDAWNMIRSQCNYNTRLSVALTISQQLPPLSVQNRWFSEPLRIIDLPSTTFISNAKQEVTLSHEHQQLIFRYMRLRNPPWMLLSDIGALSGVDASTGSILGHSAPDRQHAVPKQFDPTPSQAFKKTTGLQLKQTSYVTYLRQVQDRQPPRDVIEQFSAGYQDYLQNPLQPLTDNLESMTYEVFEKDPIKYDWYERATAAALKDWKKKGKPASGRNGAVVVAVVGAGRGPLVTRALEASQAAGVETDVWAVEKNPNAFALLQRHFSEKWHRRVNLARSDMRSWKGPFYYQKGPESQPGSSRKVHYKVDILISELLGSFGDNELSPECLDGVQNVLNTTHGISIPSSYTAHLTPIAAPKLHSSVLTRVTSGDAEAAQIPYVVMLHAIDYLSTVPSSEPLDQQRETLATLARPKACPNVLQAWDFIHPTNAPQVKQLGVWENGHGNEHNRRFARLEFPCKDRGVCHGLGGYFETVLYDPGADGVAASATTAGPKGRGKGAGDDGVEKVELSTNPLTMDDKSRDMISWFPIYFPLKSPLYFPDSSVLCISMWRQTDGRRVWYEWMVESFLLIGAAQSAASNQKRIRLAVTDLHSSIKNACLM